jgi:hypothetical protein
VRSLCGHAPPPAGGEQVRERVRDLWTKALIGVQSIAHAHFPQTAITGGLRASRSELHGAVLRLRGGHWSTSEYQWGVE